MRSGSGTRRLADLLDFGGERKEKNMTLESLP